MPQDRRSPGLDDYSYSLARDLRKPVGWMGKVEELEAQGEDSEGSKKVMGARIEGILTI